jgi:hypothetical protein
VSYLPNYRGAGRLKLGQRMHLLSSIVYTDNETLKLNVDAFITLNMNIDYNAIVLNLLVVDFPQFMMLRSTMLHRCPRWT